MPRALGRRADATATERRVLDRRGAAEAAGRVGATSQVAWSWYIDTVSPSPVMSSVWPWDMHEFVVRDPDGNLILFGSPA